MYQDQVPGPHESWLASGGPGSEKCDSESKARTAKENDTPDGGALFRFESQVSAACTAGFEVQRDRALTRANYVRLERSRLRRDMGAGSIDIDFVLTEKPEVLCKVPVFEILQWLPHVGPSRARKMIRGGRIISETLPLGSLGPKSQVKLQAEIRRRLGKIGTGVAR